MNRRGEGLQERSRRLVRSIWLLVCFRLTRNDSIQSNPQARKEAHTLRGTEVRNEEILHRLTATSTSSSTSASSSSDSGFSSGSLGLVGRRRVGRDRSHPLTPLLKPRGAELELGRRRGRSIGPQKVSGGGSHRRRARSEGGKGAILPRTTTNPPKPTSNRKPTVKPALKSELKPNLKPTSQPNLKQKIERSTKRSRGVTPAPGRSPVVPVRFPVAPGRSLVAPNKFPAVPGLIQCPNCTRSFAPDRADRHIAVCAQAAGTSRKVYDVAAARVQGTDAEAFQGQRRGRGEGKRGEQGQDWRRGREEFVRTLREARRAARLIKQGVSGWVCHNLRLKPSPRHLHLSRGVLLAPKRPSNTSVNILSHNVEQILVTKTMLKAQEFYQITL